MERFVKGNVVVLPFPYSNLSSSKKRPAMVLANLKGDDVILCQVASQFVKDNYAIALNDSDFKKGSLNKPSNIRPNRLARLFGLTHRFHHSSPILVRGIIVPPPTLLRLFSDSIGSKKCRRRVEQAPKKVRRRLDLRQLKY
jgi:mRNA interferase MazF